MPVWVFLAVFFATWLVAGAYILSVLKLRREIRDLKSRGGAPDAPDLAPSMEGIPGLFWVITGRYQKLGDDVVAGWARLARVLFFAGVPMMLVVFVTAMTQMTPALR